MNKEQAAMFLKQDKTWFVVVYFNRDEKFVVKDKLYGERSEAEAEALKLANFGVFPTAVFESNFVIGYMGLVKETK